MKVHWAHQWIQIPYEGSLVKLFGQLSTLLAGSVLHLCNSVIDSEPVTAPSHPPEIHKLLDAFPHLFEPPTQLPPSRACDHSIPLVAGASPTYCRPYRFAPMVKDEIEKQVHEMLESRLIQKSSSPFSSPVLLVKKKDNTWRFCVDY